MSGHISRVRRAACVRVSNCLLRACTYCFISQPCLCLHLPWVDLRVSHPARSFIEEEITVTSLFGALCAAGENIVIVCHHAFLPPPRSLIDYNVANTQSCVR